jgi:2-oxoglutarate ferredoxin oxidoreductase subunit delta
MKFHVLIDRDRCKGCALCVASCDKGVLALSVEMNAKGLVFAEVKAPQNCVGCRKCAVVCPDAAVEIEKETDDQQAARPTRTTQGPATFKPNP